MGGDEEINDDDEETPLDEDGDGDGVEGVGEPLVTAVADIFFAVNDKGMLLLPNVSKVVAVLAMPAATLFAAAAVAICP